MVPRVVSYTDTPTITDSLTAFDPWVASINKCLALPAAQRVSVDASGAPTAFLGDCAKISGFTTNYLHNGYTLLPGITIPNNALTLTVGNDGTVTVTVPGQVAPQQIGQIQIANFVNPAGLEAKGQNLFTETAASGTPNTGAPNANGLGAIQQGFVETSNVNVVEELVQMIQTQRAYEMNSKAIQTSDQMLAKLAQL